VPADLALLESVSALHLIDVLGVLGIFLILFAETGLLLGFFLPGDSLLFVAGYATVAGNSLHLDLPLGWLLVVAPLGAVIGAQVGYEIGRRAGPRLFNRPESRLFRPEYVERSAAVLARFGVGRAVVVARFIPIVRTFLNPVAGVSGVPVRTFALWNVVGGVFWTVGLILLGNTIGDVGFIRDHIEVLALVVVAISVTPLLFEVSRQVVRNRRA
jgi:membrane-associated protein